MNAVIRNIRTQRSIVILALAAVVLTGILSGLSILPHGHDGGAHHEPGSSCAVYQFSLAHVDLAVAAVFLIVLFELIRSVVPETDRPSVIASLPQRNLRAPPTIP